MAFVCESQRLLHEYNKTTQNIGPGQYKTFDVRSFGKTNEAPAPFNSSALKKSIYDKRQILANSSSSKIGPGYYQIESPFEKKNIRTYVNNRSVIIKIDSLESNQFKSNVPRFKSLQQEGPGPGQYLNDPKASDFGYEIRKNALQKRKMLKEKIQSFISQLKSSKKIQYKPSIPSKTVKLQKKSNALNQNQQKQTTSLSAQQNESIEKSPKKSRGFTWAKSQRKFITDLKTNSIERSLGPGKYFKERDYDQNQKLQSIIDPNKKTFRKRAKTQTCVFRSKYARTFFDQMCYETNSNDKAQLRNKENYKTSQPGPGYYNIEKGLKLQSKNSSKHNFTYQFFGSTVERFPSEPKEEQPIDYLFPNNRPKMSTNSSSFNDHFGKNRSFNKRQHAFLSDLDKKMTFIPEQNDLPGPGQYETIDIKQAFKPRKGKIIQNFGYSKQRFTTLKTTSKDANQEDQYSYDNTETKKKKQSQSFMFKSKIKKQAFGIKTQHNQVFGTYDVTQNDLGSKLKKQAIFLQNLKKIQVEVPAFNSGNQRFTYNKKSRSLSAGKSQLDKDNKKTIFLNTKTQEMRQKVIQKNKEQVVKSKKSTIYNADVNNDRFETLQLKQKKKTPGVGNYSLRSNWNKQTYNIKYHTSSIKAQVSSARKVPIQNISTFQY